LSGTGSFSEIVRPYADERGAVGLKCIVAIQFEAIDDHEVTAELEVPDGATSNARQDVTGIHGLATIAGKLELNPEPVSLARLIDEVVGTAGQLAEKNQNRLIVEAQENAGTLNADSLRLKQILLNLLSNACKFTKEGEVALRERARLDAKSAEIGPQGMIDHSYFWLPRREGSAMKIKPLRGSEHDAPRSVSMAFGILFIV